MKADWDREYCCAECGARIAETELVGRLRGDGEGDGSGYGLLCAGCRVVAGMPPVERREVRLDGREDGDRVG
jgi:hypothetical protein